MEFDRNPTLDALCARKSVRVFTEEPVPQAVKNALFQAAMQAPTAGNQMLYTILDITDAALKARLADLCDHQPFIADAPVVLVFVADCQRWYDGFAAAGCAPRPPREGDLLLAAADAAIAAQNTVVAAESFGLGSCYIGDILENFEDVRSALALPPYAVPAAMLVLGYYGVDVMLKAFKRHQVTYVLQLPRGGLYAIVLVCIFVAVAAWVVLMLCKKGEFDDA